MRGRRRRGRVKRLPEERSGHTGAYPKIILPPPVPAPNHPIHTHQPSLVKFSFFGHSQKSLNS